MSEDAITQAARTLGQLGGSKKTPEQKRALDEGRALAHRAPRTPKQLESLEKGRLARRRRPAVKHGL
jgi:hypothetical protein